MAEPCRPSAWAARAAAEVVPGGAALVAWWPSARANATRLARPLEAPR